MASRKASLAAGLAAALLLGAGARPALAQTLTEPPAPAAQPAPGAPAAPAPGTPPAPPPTAPVPIPQPQRPLDLIVTVTLATGQAETFAREIDRMEIILRADGGIHMVHLVLVAGGERNTHVWYNYDEVAKLSYRFVTAEGRSKVYVRLLQPIGSERELTDRLEPLSPREFR